MRGNLISSMLTASAVLVGTIASALSTDNIYLRSAYILAAVISLVALVLQVRAARPFVLGVSPSDWLDAPEDEVQIVIEARKHGRGKTATGRLEQALEGGGFALVEGGVETRINGDVVTSISRQSLTNFKGRIVIS